MWFHGLLLGIVLVLVWFPAETHPWSALLLALALFLLIPRCWPLISRGAARPWVLVVAALALWLVLSALVGGDRAQALVQGALIVAAFAVWLAASRRPPDPRALLLFALGLAALALWAVYQVSFGFERSLAAVHTLSGAEHDYALERLSSGRAFASLLVPGHLGALLATALALLLPTTRTSWRSPLRLGGLVLCVTGLILTYSPLALALATLVAVALVLGRQRRALVLVALILATALAAAFAVRPDLARLQPLELRLDNWRTALWVWSSSPISGVGFGSYGQASLAVPFDVGNRPQHAHCLPLELLAEQGLLGAALIAGAVLWLGVVVRRLWPQHPGMAVALLVVPLHNLADFSFYTSALLLPWALLAGWAWALVRREGPAGSPLAARPAALCAASVLLVGVCLHASSAALDGAVDAHEDVPQALADCRRAHRLAPWRPEPVQAFALLALTSGHAAWMHEAEEMLERSRWQRPNSVTMAMLHARLAWRRGAADLALSRAARAHAMDPAASKLDLEYREMQRQFVEKSRALGR